MIKIKISKMVKRIIIIASAAVLAVMLISILISLGVLAKELRKRNETLYNAITEQTERIELLQRNAVDVSNDLNNVRTSLLLPSVEYPVLQKNDDSQETGDLVNYLMSIDVIVEKNREYDANIFFDNFINSSGFSAFIKSNNLSTDKKGYFVLEIKSSGTLLGNISIDPGSMQLNYTDILSNSSDFSDVLELKQLINKSKAGIEAHSKLVMDNSDFFRKVSSDNSVKQNLLQNKASIKYSSADPYQFEILNNAEIREDLFTYSASDNKFRSASGLETDSRSVFLDYLVEKISFVETRSEIEIFLESCQETINNLAADESFQLALKSKNLRFVTTPRIKEEEYFDYIFFDILDSDDKLIGSFGMLKNNGMLYIMDRNDLPITSVGNIQNYSSGSGDTKKKAVIPDEIPEISDLFSDNDSITVAAIGSHENDADAIILIHGNKKTDSLYLISIPRDIFYNGQKINNILKVFGPQKFIEELSVITGLQIDNYVQIDMYAFIDAVNIVGGIDIVLKEPVIDPTMKVINNGIEGTLHYSAGPHHLDGRNALRLARSRHYSSDFDRADRIQQLIVALKDGFYENNSISTIYELVNTLIKYVDTNLKPVEIVNLLIAFKNAEINKQEVLSTGNVLYPTYSEELKAAEKGYELEEDSYKGLWILMPLDNDWNKIRYYIRRIIGEVQNG